ncbi:MAG: hypothetical protein M3O86_01300, partial [Actinomycetota bacterium]|nr:hypothetical protein [Actinomycetota bacterium]
MVTFPKGAAGAAQTFAGQTEWRWTANFEAFDAFPRRVHPDGQTPDGTYRFVVDGLIRSGGKATPYHLESEPFRISPWDGITVRDGRVEPDGDVSFAVDDIAYPRTYASPFRFVKDDGRTTICRTCSFRSWASRGEVAAATVTVTRASGAVEQVPAAFDA